MVYYKIPVTDGVFDYPTGCVLCCAYYVDGFMFCKFENCPEVGSGWAAITESEFNVRCPEFQEPDLPPVQEAIASSSTLADGSIVLELPAKVDTGTLVKFSAPCACEGVTGGIVIDGTTYSIVDAAGKTVAGINGAWESGALLSVLIDATNLRAFLLNAIIDGGDAATLGGKKPEDYAAADHKHFTLPDGTYGDTAPETLEDGQFFLLIID